MISTWNSLPDVSELFLRSLSCTFRCPTRQCPRSTLLIVFINDLPQSTLSLIPFLFVDDTKSLQIIKSSDDINHLQEDINNICDLLGLTKGTYSLSDRVTLWPHRIKKLKYISLKFLQTTLLRFWSLVCKMHWHRPSRKKVMSSQSQKSRKAISPLLSDRVTFHVEAIILIFSSMKLKLSIFTFGQVFRLSLTHTW